jgi:Kef-type K+ transport system membrane component KefB
MDNEFYLIAAVLGVAAAVGFVANRLRQPLIVAFIAVGILVGPAGTGWVQDNEPLELFAEIGIAVLLFLVGLKLELRLVRTTGPVALVTGLGQVAFTSVIGFFIGLALGLDRTTALYVAVALTFSSTIIIVKLLSDKRELEELHGRIAIGFLIVQDVVVIVVMIVLSAFGGERDGTVGSEALLVLGKGVGFLAVLGVAARWILPAVLRQAARSQELLLIFAVAWAVSVAAIGDVLGFSTEVGAFLAGFALASTPYREAIGARLTTLRDFLLLFFFIELGSQLDFAGAANQVVPALVLSAFVLIGNPLIVMVIMGVMGYRKRVGFLAGLTVAQISEFSLILVALGLSLGHITDETLGLVTLVGVVTIGLSTYLIIYSHPLYTRLAPLLSVFERAEPTKGGGREEGEVVDVIVYGSGRYGGNLVRHLLTHGARVMVVDWDPSVLTTPSDRSDERAPVVVFGDAEDVDFPGTLPLHSARWVVSTVPRFDTNRMLVAALRQWGYEGRIATTAHTDDDAAKLRSLEVDAVLTPFASAAESSAQYLLAEGVTDPNR